MTKNKILFVCVHNIARSQMAEAWANHLFGDSCQAESAGLEPGVLNPMVVEAMREYGIDISHKIPQSVFELFKAGKTYDYVVTVCDQTKGQMCPVFPGGEQMHWSFDDPSALTGSHEEKMASIRKIRDEIRASIEEWLSSMND